MRREHRTFLPARHLAEIGSGEIDPPVGLIEQAVIVRVVALATFPAQHPRTEAIGNVLPADVEASAIVAAFTAEIAVNKTRVMTDSFFMI